MIARPLYLDKLKAYIDKPFVKVLVGMRRVGKSTILSGVKEILLERGIKPEKIVQINFESLDYINIRTKDDFKDLVKSVLAGGGRHYLLLDELQNIDGWDEVINGILADNLADIYITGSNSKLLSAELSTFLTGRFVNIQVFPLNFQEFLMFREAQGIKNSAIDEAFVDYLNLGGLPVIHTADYTKEQCDEIIADIHNSIIFKDLVERKGIRNIELLRRVVKYVFDNIGNTFSAQSIKDFLKNEYRNADIETIYNYLDALEEVFVIKKVPRYDIRGKKILKTDEKYFLGDVGLLYATNGRNLSLISGVLENVVLNELLSRGYEVYIGKNNKCEIDFVAERGSQKMYLQIAAQLNNIETINREFEAFRGITDNYPKYVLSLDKGWSEDREGIKQRFLPEFLLEEI